MIQSSPGSQGQGKGSGNQGGQHKGADDFKNKARDIADRVKGSEAVNKMQQQASSVVQQQREKAAERLESVAEAIRNSAHNVEDEAHIPGVSRIADQAAEQVERFSEYVRSHDLREVYRDVEGFARRHPVLVIGGALVAGLIIARVLRSSSQSESSQERWRERELDWESDFSPGEMGYEGASEFGSRGSAYQTPAYQGSFSGFQGMSRRESSDSPLTGGTQRSDSSFESTGSQGSSPTSSSSPGGSSSGSSTGQRSSSEQRGESSGSGGSGGRQNPPGNTGTPGRAGRSEQSEDRGTQQ